MSRRLSRPFASKHPNIWPPIIRVPHCRCHLPAVGRNSQSTNIMGWRPDRADGTAGSVVPLQLRKRPTRLIDQDAVVGN